MSEDDTVLPAGLRATPKSARPEQPPSEQPPSDWSRPEAQQIGAMTAAETRLIRARQDSRSRVLGIILAGLCLLFFAITIVKIGVLS